MSKKASPKDTAPASEKRAKTSKGCRVGCRVAPSPKTAYKCSKDKRKKGLKALERLQGRLQGMVFDKCLFYEGYFQKVAGLQG
jgi:hypothetical protein